ncbi:MAG: zinc-ribbon domain-containing protein [Candidatus Hermodarchaeota archaeon]
MYYCQNCGAKLESAQNFCSFCGFSLEKESEYDDKDAKINELEQKIARLEQGQVKRSSSKPFSPWFAIVPIAFVAVFFGFFILLIWIVRQ